MAAVLDTAGIQRDICELRLEIYLIWGREKEQKRNLGRMRKWGLSLSI